MVIWSDWLICLVELTVPFEAGNAEAPGRKRAKYKELLGTCAASQRTAHLITIEMGSRGFINAPRLDELYRHLTPLKKWSAEKQQRERERERERGERESRSRLRLSLFVRRVQKPFGKRHSTWLRRSSLKTIIILTIPLDTSYKLLHYIHIQLYSFAVHY